MTRVDADGMKAQCKLCLKGSKAWSGQLVYCSHFESISVGNMTTYPNNDPDILTVCLSVLFFQSASDFIATI